MKYIIKETQYKRLIEQAEDATSSTDASTATVQTARYGDISRVPGSETDAVASLTAGQIGQTIELFTDKELRKRYGNYSLESMTKNNEQIVATFKASENFNLTASCSTLSTNPEFLKGTTKYYSKGLLDMALEKCKS